MVTNQSDGDNSFAQAMLCQADKMGCREFVTAQVVFPFHINGFLSFRIGHEDIKALKL